MKVPTEALFARIRRSAAASRQRLAARGGPPKPDPGVVCPYLKSPWGERFRCFVHRNPQAQADNDFICRKLCLPKGGPFKQTIRPRGIPTGGRQPIDLRGLDIPAWKRPSRLSPNQRPPRDSMRRRIFGRRVA